VVEHSGGKWVRVGIRSSIYINNSKNINVLHTNKTLFHSISTN